MSAIFGFVHTAQHAVAHHHDLAPMFASAAHWGPDGTQTASHGPAAFGHAALVNWEASLAQRQPVVDPRWPHLLLTADVSIDDRDSVLDDLGLSGHARDVSDSALVLEAYARWGPDCVDRIHGAFAIAVWDAHARTLFCARDAVGLRPLYYWDGPDRFVFATDVRAILAMPGVPSRRDEVAVAAHYVGVHRYLASRSFFHDIHRLRGGHSILVGPSGVSLRRWWEPGRGSEIRLATVADYTDALREQLSRAVGRSLRPPGPVGSHLSAGLDSSAVTALAARHLRAAGRPDPLAYSWSPASERDSPKAEGHLINRVLKRTGLSCTFTDLGVEDMAAVLNRDFSLEPVDSIVSEQVVCRRAAADGVRVMLSGWGGDECVSFNGRGYFADLAIRGRWWTLARELASASAVTGTGAFRFALARVLLPWAPDWLYWLGFSATRQARLGRRVVLALRETDPHIAHAAESFLRQRFIAVREGRSVRQVQRALLLGGHLASRLESWAYLGASVRLTYRYPLLDRGVLDFALRLPASMYFQQGWKRFVFRKAVDGLLPADVCWTPVKADPEATARLSRIRTDLGAAAVVDPNRSDLVRQNWRIFLLQRGVL